MTKAPDPQDETTLGLDYSTLMLPPVVEAAPPVASRAPISGPGNPPKMRRTVHLSTMSTLLFALPSSMYSLMCLGIVGGAISFGNPALGFLGWFVPLLWMVVGALLFYPPVEKVFVRNFMGLREPTVNELRALQPLWNRVTARAGVDAGTFILSVEDSAQLNASAAAGHSVAVTVGALGHLEERHLQAVLAHELGHHLGGHSVAALWNYWVALPGRFFNRLAQGFYGIINAIIRVFSFRGWLMSIAIVAVTALALVATAPWLLIILLVPLGLAAASRASELAADKVAVELGYGSDMIDVLEIFSSLEAAPVGGPGARFAGWMSSHPPSILRIDRIQRLMEL